jgi:ATP-binding cassette, subfamily B, bacterial
MAKRNSKEPLAAEEKRPLNKASMQKLAGVFQFMLPYKGIFLVGLFALAISTCTTLIVPRLAGELLDIAAGSPKYFTTINEAGFVLMIILLLQGISSFVRVYTFTIVSEKGVANLRKKVFEKIIWLPLSFFDSRRVGEIMSRISSDISTLQDTFSFTLAEFLRQVFTLIIGTIVICTIAPKLSAFMLLTIPVIVVSALIFGKFIRKLSKKTQDKLAETNVIVEESLQSISVVKAFTNENFETKRYNNTIGEAVRIALYSGKYRALFISFIVSVMFAGIVGVWWYGANLVQSGDMTPGVLVSFIMFTVIIGFSMAGLGDIFAQIQRSIGASERVLELLHEPGEPQTEGLGVKLKGEITFKNVSFSYPSRSEFQVLKELNFSIRAGEKVALVGQSGSGKSTIINLLMRFYSFNEGEIKADGKIISDYNLVTYRKNLGIVPQDVILFGGTIEENIAYGKPGSTFKEIQEAAQKANALDFIESFPDKFNTIVGERGVKLSGGQRQRIAIARAILKDPAILILDEATSSLDAKSEVLVQQALEKLMEGRTTIIIAHRLSTIKKVDRIFVIQEGRLAEMGTHDELRIADNGIYSNLLKLQLH